MARKPRRPYLTREELKRAEGASAEAAELAQIIRDAVALLRRLE